MTCRKCSHQNEENAKFCSACGEKFDGGHVQTRVPIWIWIVLIVSCITMGGVGYGLWDYYNEAKSVPTYKETSHTSNTHPVEQTATVEKEERQEQ